MAAIDPGIPARPARPVVAARPRRATRAKVTFPYINRELSWLEFNARVLHEARDERNPLLERVKFLAINLQKTLKSSFTGKRYHSKLACRPYIISEFNPFFSINLKITAS